jgi:integrase
LKRLTTATANRVLALLKAIMTWANRAGLIKENPAMLVSLLRENNRRERYFTPDEIRRLFRAADQHQSFYTGQYVKMLLLTGLRRAELAEAKWQHYNKEEKTLYIPHTKNGHSRVLHLNHMAVDLLNYLPVRPGNPYLFPGHRKGKPLQNPTKGFQKMLSRAGIDKEGVCLHTCRHSVAALIVSNGGTLFDVQSQLGHRSSQTSLRYAHLHDTRMQQTSQRIANCIHDALTHTPPQQQPLLEEAEWEQAS